MIAAFIDRLAGYFLGAGCRLCAGACDGGRELCAHCHADLPFLGARCRLCAEPLALPGVCGRCQRHPPPFAGTVVPMRYAGEIAALVRAFKLSRDLAGGRVLGELLADACRQRGEIPKTIVPLPLHPQRLRARGFNQAVELARYLPGHCRHDLLYRRRATPTQTGLNRAARQRNVRGAFRTGANAPPWGVLLVDDVITTGATLAEAAITLRRAGVAEVWVAAVARAGNTTQ